MKIKLTIIFVIALGLLSATYLFFTDKNKRLYNCNDCNVVVISMTNLRYDHVSGNGYVRKTTPNIDLLIKDSVVFDNTFSHASWTLPENISLYTSLYPFQHGIVNRYDGTRLSEKTMTLIDLLKQNGYKTAAFTGGFDYNPEFGLTNRFDHYEECAKGQSEFYPRQRGPVSGMTADYGELSCSAPKAINWLKQNKMNKFYVHVQGFDAHCPFSQSGGKMFDPNYVGDVDFSKCLWTFEQTEPQMQNGELKYQLANVDENGQPIWVGTNDIQHLEAIYDESIFYADMQIGKIIDEIKLEGLWDKTIVVVTSEHGDMFGKHGRFMRGGPLRGTFYDDVLHVPFIVHMPNIEPKRINGLVAQIDFMPTLLDMLGYNSPPNIEGKSVLPVIFNNKVINKYIYSGSKYTPSSLNPIYNSISRVETIRSEDWKLIRETLYQPKNKIVLNPGELSRTYNIEDSDLKVEKVNLELFDLKNDPKELNNQFEKNLKVKATMIKLLDKWWERVGTHN